MRNYLESSKYGLLASSGYRSSWRVTLPPVASSMRLASVFEGYLSPRKIWYKWLSDMPNRFMKAFFDSFDLNRYSSSFIITSRAASCPCKLTFYTFCAQIYSFCVAQNVHHGAQSESFSQTPHHRSQNNV